MSDSANVSNTNPNLVDPLSEVTRKERLYLLAASTVGITIVFTGLVPSEIRALGITFARADRRSLLVMLALVIVYFLVAFIIYAASDFLAWRNLFRTRNRERRRARMEADMLDEVEYSGPDPTEGATLTVNREEDVERTKRRIQREVDFRLRNEEYERRSIRFLLLVTGPVSFLRALFEFGLPVLYGIFAIVILLFVGLPNHADGGASLEFMRAYNA